MSELSNTVPFVDLRRGHTMLAAELAGAYERVLSASDFILGEEVGAFEAEFAERCEVPHCVGVASGTAALTIMLQAAGIGPGDEVIVPAHTFLATALSVIHIGAKPVWVDVDKGTGLIDPRAAEAMVGPRTAAVIAVHLYGQVSPMDELQALTERHGIALFEDAAQAHGATYRGKPAGGLARAAAFSFYPSKNLGALGDAGAICTADPELADAARRLRDLGRGGDGTHLAAGYNERLDGIQAAFLRVKLPHLDDFNRARRAIAARYRSAFTDVELLSEAPESPCVYHLFPIRVSARDEIARALRSMGVATGVHYPLALPDQPPLRGFGGADPSPVARDWAARELSLPIFPEMSDPEVERVIEALTAAISGGDTDSRKREKVALRARRL